MIRKYNFCITFLNYNYNFDFEMNKVHIKCHLLTQIQIKSSTNEWSPTFWPQLSVFDYG